MTERTDNLFWFKKGELRAGVFVDDYRVMQRLMLTPADDEKSAEDGTETLVAMLLLKVGDGPEVYRTDFEGLTEILTSEATDELYLEIQDSLLEDMELDGEKPEPLLIVQAAMKNFQNPDAQLELMMTAVCWTRSVN